MGWDDVLENDGQEFVILPEGDYTFTVTGFERGQFPGGPKIPACPKATVTLSIDNDQGVATCRTDFFLYRTVEWRMAAFFRAIGQKKHGEKAKMDWNKVIGARGKAHFKPRPYTSKTGESRQVNDVDHFYDYDPSFAMTPVHTSQEFCSLLQEMGVSAAEVNGNSPDRAEILRDFEAGRYSVLCNSMLLTEGWDCPSVDCVVMLRPTKVRSLYQQAIGRGTRLFPGKTELLILDFLWLTERHDLCRPSSLISKDSNIAVRIDQQVMDADYSVDIMAAEETAERDALAERERALAEQLAIMRNRTRKLVDPLQYAMSIAAEDLANYPAAPGPPRSCHV